MKKLYRRPAAKVLAVVLFAVLAACIVCSAICVSLGFGNGVYPDEAGRRIDNFYETQLLRSRAYQFGFYELLDTYLLYGDVSDIAESSAESAINFDFRLVRQDEGAEPEVIADTLREDCIYGFTHTWERSATATASEETADAAGQTADYAVTVAVRDPMPVRDGALYWYGRLTDLVAAHGTLLMVVLVVSAALALADVVFLCAAAGHRDGQAAVVPNWMDRLPLEVYLLMMGIAVAIPLGLTVEFGFWTVSPFWNTLGILGIAAVSLLCVAVLMSVATRVKLGKWWRNTLTYRILHWCRNSGLGLLRLVGKSFRAIPLVWRTLLASGVTLILLWVLGYNSNWDGIAMFFYLLLSLVILGAAGFAVLQMRRIQKAGEALAAGRFDTKIDLRHMYWDFRCHAQHLNAIGDGMGIAVEQRIRSERLKTELITNVSHDIKTPLTSIINYVDLLQKPHDPAEDAHYLQVLQRQSARLKKLTEDLVEASKASTGNLSVALVPTNVAESVNQALGEYQERLAAGGLTVVTTYPQEDAAVLADGRLLWRVLDNLLGNVGKYALAGTRVYVDVTADAESVVISVKNISREPLNVSADELMERFVRGDTARTTEGSGLGLNIARSLMELQHGTLTLTVDGDLFKAALRFPRLQPEA